MGEFACTSLSPSLVALIVLRDDTVFSALVASRLVTTDEEKEIIPNAASPKVDLAFFVAVDPEFFFADLSNALTLLRKSSVVMFNISQPG